MTRKRAIQLLGRPVIVYDGHERPGPRGHKTWALLAYLALADRPPSRGRLAALLFADADDPLAALRWTLSELRRFLTDTATVTGDPVALELARGVAVDVRSLAAGGWTTDDLLALDDRLLDGLQFPGAPGFAAWLEMQRQRLSVAVHALINEAAVAALAHNRAAEAAALATRLVELDPADPGNRALLQQALAPEPIMASYRNEIVSSAAVRSYLDAGKASLSVGALDQAFAQLGRAADEARATGDKQLHAAALVAFAGGRIHGAGARGADVAALLHEALGLSRTTGDVQTASTACRELAFLGVQLGHLERADVWLAEADRLDVDDAETASVLGVKGMRLSDGAEYPAALYVLARSVEHAAAANTPRQAAWSRSMAARVHLLRQDIPAAIAELDLALETVQSTRWTAFAPWVESLRAEAAITMGDLELAHDLLDHAWVLATETRDHCWMTTVARGQAQLSAVRGDDQRALQWVEDGLRPPPWYAWVSANLLDAGCDAAVTNFPVMAEKWAGTLGGVAARGGMREHVARAHFHHARLGVPHAIDAARDAAADVDNDALHGLLSTWRG